MRAYSTENWLSPTLNRESFQHVQSLFPTARLRRGAGEPSALPTALATIDHIMCPTLDGSMVPMPQLLEDTYTDSLVILRHGTLIHEHYASGMQADSVHLLNSVSKTFLGMLAGILVGDGLIDLDAPVSTYAPHLTGSALEQTTVRQALDMTSGVKFNEDYAVPDDDFWVETSVLGWRPDLTAKAGTGSLKDFASGLTETEQGEGLHYRTLLTNVVAMVLEGATQTPVQTLMEQRLWQKLKPEYEGNVVVDATGFPYFGAGMSISARDLARFGQMLLNDGALEGEQIVPADWVQATRAGSDKHRAQFAAADDAGILPGWHYQNQTWVSTADSLLLGIGIYGQNLYVHQPSGIVIAKLSTQPEPANEGLLGQTFLLLNALQQDLST